MIPLQLFQHSRTRILPDRMSCLGVSRHRSAIIGESPEPVLREVRTYRQLSTDLAPTAVRIFCQISWFIQLSLDIVTDPGIDVDQLRTLQRLCAY